MRHVAARTTAPDMHSETDSQLSLANVYCEWDLSWQSSRLVAWCTQFKSTSSRVQENSAAVGLPQGQSEELKGIGFAQCSYTVEAQI